MDSKREKEPFMGMISVHRISGQKYLFDSDVIHNNFVRIELEEADREWHLSQHWIHGHNRVFTLDMSEIQWAQFVSSFGTSGTPCTIAYREGKRVADPLPPEADAKKFQRQASETCASGIDAAKEAVKKLEDVISGKSPASKTNLREVLGFLEKCVRELSANLAFVETQFTENLESKMGEAKAEFEGYLGHRLRELGIDAVRLQQIESGAPMLLESKK